MPIKITVHSSDSINPTKQKQVTDTSGSWPYISPNFNKPFTKPQFQPTFLVFLILQSMYFPDLSLWVRNITSCRQSSLFHDNRGRLHDQARQTLYFLIVTLCDINPHPVYPCLTHIFFLESDSSCSFQCPLLWPSSLTTLSKPA